VIISTPIFQLSMGRTSMHLRTLFKILVSGKHRRNRSLLHLSSNLKAKFQPAHPRASHLPQSKPQLTNPHVQIQRNLKQLIRKIGQVRKARYPMERKGLLTRVTPKQTVLTRLGGMWLSASILEAYTRRSPISRRQRPRAMRLFSQR
jgi:hypothetical protein